VWRRTGQEKQSDARLTPWQCPCPTVSSIHVCIECHTLTLRPAACDAPAPAPALARSPTSSILTSTCPGQRALVIPRLIQDGGRQLPYALGTTRVYDGRVRRYLLRLPSSSYSLHHPSVDVRVRVHLACSLTWPPSPVPTFVLAHHRRS
jgi:hypothetical protein